MNIIFLDIDGVMKPARSYLKAGNIKNTNGGFDELSVAAVNKICTRCDAKIVFNTTWNYRHSPDIIEIAKAEGIIGEILGKTNYPRTDSRLEAIQDWIKNHPSHCVTKWVALDDAPIKHENAVCVEAEFGIGVNDYIKATEILGNRDSFLILM